MSRYQELSAELLARPRRWLVTGVAGFIGSHLLEKLLLLDQEVVGLDNFSTGSRENLEDVKSRVGAVRAARFRFVEGDIRDPFACSRAMDGVELVLHQAALGSVPRSMKDPLSTHASNVDGFVQVLLAGRAAGVRRIVYASSSSVYGDDPSEPKVEGVIGQTLSPYAASKRIDEIYAATFAKSHGLDSVGLRYFNVFGPRQDPNGAYAAVIPRWIGQLLAGDTCAVYGDGSTSRDFCYVENVVQANLLAACAASSNALPAVFNVACGDRTSLLELFASIRGYVSAYLPAAADKTPRLEASRPGDILHSRACIDLARARLGYAPAHDVSRGLQITVQWYADRAIRRAAKAGTADAYTSPRV
ncbi:MAG TPA: NAD-dependent epimerase/dehydratase family protein [Polyangiaceae bacterium]